MGRTAMPLILRRDVLLGGLAASLCARPGWATLPASIVDQAPIGRDRMLVVHEDKAGRIIAADSSSYLVKLTTKPSDVIVIGSYGGTPILALLYSRGVKAIIATDAGI